MPQDLKSALSAYELGTVDADYMDKLATENFEKSAQQFIDGYDIDYQGEEMYYGFMNATIIWEKILDKKPDVAEKLLKCYYMSSDFYVDCEFNYKRSVINYESAIKIAQNLPQNDPKNQHLLAEAYSKFAGYLQNVDENFGSAKQYLSKALKIRELMPKDNANFLNSLANDHYLLALLEQDHLSNDKSAIKHYASAINYWEMMPENNLSYQSDLATAYFNLAELEAQQPKLQKSAKEHYIKAIEVFTPLSNEDYYHQRLEKMHYNLASLLQNSLDEYENAIEHYQKAVEHLQQINLEGNIKARHELAMSYNNMAYTQQNHLKDFTAAKENYLKAISVSETLPKDNVHCINGLSHEYYNIADLYEKNFKDYTSAVEYYTKAVNMEHWLSIVSPQDHLVNVDAFNYSLAQALYLSGEKEKGLSILESIQPLAQKCEELNPDDRYTHNVNSSVINALKDFNRYQTSEQNSKKTTIKYDYFISYRHYGYGKSVFHFKKILEKYGKKVFIADSETCPENRQAVLDAIAKSRHYIVTANDEDIDSLEHADDYYSELLKIADELKSNEKDALIVDLNVPNNQLVKYLIHAEAIDYVRTKYECFEEEFCSKLGIIYNPDIQVVDDPDYLMSVAMSFKNYGQRDGGRECYDKAVKIAERLPQDNPKYQEFMATLYTYLGNVGYNAQEYYRRAISLREHLPQTPENLKQLEDLRGSLRFVEGMEKR